MNETNIIVSRKETVITTYGYRVYDEHKNAEIKSDENGIRLFLGKHEVKYNENVFVGKIPKLYCVREKEGSRFVCGLDLMNDGNVWTGVSPNLWYDNVNDAIEAIEKKINKPVYICIEEESVISE